MPLSPEQIADMDKISGAAAPQQKSSLSPEDIAAMDKILGNDDTAKSNPNDMGAFAAGVQGFNNTVPFGNRLTAGAAAAASYPVAKIEGVDVSLGDLYDTAREKQEATEQAHPIASNVGTGAGIVNSLPIFLSTGGANAAPVIGDAANAIQKGNAAAADWLGDGNIWSRLLKGSAAGAATGGVYGAGNAPEGQMAEGAKEGAMAGGVVGGALPLAGAALSPIANAIKPFYESGREGIVGNFLKNQATGELQNVAENELIKGSKPTLGQATGDYGILSLERGMRNSNPLDFAQLESANNAARNQAFEGIAGTPEKLIAEQEARAAAAKPLYEQAGKVNVTSDQEFQDISSRPSFQKALRRAQTLASERGEPLVIGKDLPATIEKSPILDAHGQAMQSLNPAQNAQYSGKGLQYVKMAMDDMLDNPAASGIGKHEISAIKSTRGDLLDWLSEKNPAYTQANATYAQMSKPINQMEALQNIQGKAKMPIPDPQTGYDYLSQAKLSRLFDTQKGDLQKTLSPEQYSTLQNIVSDLDRASASNAPNLRAAGSDTVQNLTAKNLASNIVGRKIGESPLVQTAMRPISWLYQLPEEKMRDILKQALLNPGYAKQILEQSSKKTLPPILSAIGGGEAGRGITAATGGIGDQNMQELQKLKPPVSPQSNNAVPDVSSFAKAESGGNPNAKNPNSSASGLYQFTNRTWQDLVMKYGKQTGIGFGDKNNPQAQATMAALYAKDNIASLQKTIGRMPTKGELYQAHVLGSSGAARLINAPPNQEAIMLFPRPVFDANRSIFFQGNRPRTVAEVKQLLDSKVA